MCSRNSQQKLYVTISNKLPASWRNKSKYQAVGTRGLHLLTMWERSIYADIAFGLWVCKPFFRCILKTFGQQTSPKHNAIFEFEPLNYFPFQARYPNNNSWFAWKSHYILKLFVGIGSHLIAILYADKQVLTRSRDLGRFTTADKQMFAAIIQYNNIGLAQTLLDLPITLFLAK